MNDLVIVQPVAGDFFVVDSDVWPDIKGLAPFYRLGDGHVVYSNGITGKGRTMISLSRTILGVPLGLTADHINGDLRDYTKRNLRVATYTQNNQNRGKVVRLGMSSEYKGVSLNKKTGRYVARIHVNGKQVNLGTYDSEEDAAKRYDRAAKQYFGEFARLNFPHKT